MISRRQLRALELVGPAEIASRLGCAPHTVATWRKRYPDFPRPELEISNAPIWRWSIVKQWCDAHGRAAVVFRGEVSREDYAAAVDLLPTVRAQLAREVRVAADSLADLLDEPIKTPPRPTARRDFYGRYSTTDGRGNGIGEWDWFYALSKDEQERIRPYFSDSPTACAPDQWAAAHEARLGQDLAYAMTQWLAAVRLDIAATMLERGEVPPFAVDAFTTYDIDEVFGEDGAAALARAWRADEDDYVTYVKPSEFVYAGEPF